MFFAAGKQDAHLVSLSRLDILFGCLSFHCPLILLQDAAILMQNVNKKADQEDVSGIEANLIQVSHQLGRLNEVLQTQNSAIRDLNSRVTMLTEEMEDLRNPNYDQMFSYVDRQVTICLQ